PRTSRRATRGRWRWNRRPPRRGGRRSSAGRFRRGRRRRGRRGAAQPRAPPRAPTRAPAARSRVDDLQQNLRGTGVVRLPEPEDRLLAELLVLLRLRDADQLIEGGGLVTLRVYEDQLLLHLLVLHPVVQPGQLVQVPAGLTDPEEGLLAHLHRLALVECDIHQPA